MKWPEISVIIPTYNRPWVLRQTIDGLKKHLVYKGKVRYIVGIDGDIGHGKMFSGDGDIELAPGPNRGLGANLNQLISHAGKYMLQMDDDHLLTQRLDLTPHVRKLKRDKTVGWIRLMGVGYHDYIAALEENYWRVWWQSPELYIPSNRPHLKHRRFHDRFGLYPEDVTLGETEEGFCRQCKDKKSGPSVLIPLDVLTESAWRHIGESWQLKGR